MTDHLTEAVKIHDKYQFELKFTYPIDREQSRNKYHIESFIFIPNNLCINSQTYSHRDFYNDTHKYIRLKTPEVLLRIMLEGENSPLKKLEGTMRQLVEYPDDSHCEDYEQRVKMFCSIMKSALRDEELFIERSRGSDDLKLLIENYLKDANEIIAKFRALKPILLTRSTGDRNMKFFLFADEFLSLTLNKYRYKLFNFFAKTEYGWLPDVKKKIISSIRDEIRHRIVCSYPSVPSEDSDNENVIYREGSLKKLMASVLFLKTAIHKDGVILENLVFSLAAGCAMAFATLVTLMTNSIANFNFQEFSVVFFAIIVIAYMFKDRIKELSRTYFYAKVKPLLYDFKTDIWSTFGKKVGICRESFSFLPVAKLPRNILRLRNRDFLAELENGYVEEDIIYSRKHIQIQTDACKNIFADFNVNGIVDIVRFNVTRFLEKMDNPVKDIFMPGSDDRLLLLKGKCVYHINIIIRYGIVGKENSYKRFRITLSRSGIKRIEEVPLAMSASDMS